MMLLTVWVPSPMFLLGRGLCAWSHVPSGGGGLCLGGGTLSRGSLSRDPFFDLAENWNALKRKKNTPYEPTG